MHIIPTSPFYSRTREGAEAANEICRAGSWVGWRLRLTGGRLPAVSCDVTARLLSLSVHHRFFFFRSLACFISRGLTFSLWDRERRLESQNDTPRVSTAAWPHVRQKPHLPPQPFHQIWERNRKRKNQFFFFLLAFFLLMLMKQIEF